jgi:hypothetical protein
MAKFGRFDSRNKKKGKNKVYSRDEKDLRIKRVETKRKTKINQTLVNKINYDYIDPTEEI